MSVNGNADSVIELRGSLSLPDAIRGKSAYEIAVEEGFNGTVEEWLESLKGDGKTPYIKDGNWWIGETDTGVKAEGVDGIGISKIEKTATNGKIDAYTITLTNNTNFTFTITNGEDGDDGVGISSIVKTASNGLVDTYTITLTDKRSVTFTVTNGKDGTNVAISSITESTEDGGSNVITFNDGKTLTIKNGKEGTSVTVSSVSESTASGGSNTVKFSDGKTLTIKNGKDGKDYVLTEADKTEIAEKIGDVIPDYVKTEAESVIDRVISAQGNRTFTFAVMTDMHYGNGSYTDGIKHACQALKYIDERIKLDAVAVLGDYTDGYPASAYANAISDFKDINKILDTLRFGQNLRIQGNHDYYENHKGEINRFISAYSESVVWGDITGGYFYKDFEGYKIRVICVNTTETGNSNIAVSKEQYEWFINSLDVSSKENATDWQILILSHHPLDWWVVDSKYRFGQIIHAYKNGSAFSDTEISCDFSGKNSAVLVANIHGHIHNLLTDTIYFTNKNNVEKTSVYRLCTPSACFGRENQYDGWNEETTYQKTQNSAEDTAFVIYCVNLDTHIIKAICYGAGYDRELDYINGISTVSYNVQYNLTNVTSSNTSANIQSGKPYSTTLSAEGDIKSVTVTMNGIDITSSVYTNGTITIDSVTGNIVITAVAEEVEKIVNLLDTVGYTDGMRFSGSNGVEKADEVCMATGCIEVSNLKSGDHIYGWGIDFNNANNSGKCVIVSYDDSKNILGQNLLNQNSSIANLKVSFDAENRLDISYNGTPVAKYIRFSGVGKGADAIVTKNQLPN